MAKIVLGMGSSHGPMLSTPPEEWGQRVLADKQQQGALLQEQDLDVRSAGRGAQSRKPRQSRSSCRSGASATRPAARRWAARRGVRRGEARRRGHRRQRSEGDLPRRLHAGDQRVLRQDHRQHDVLRRAHRGAAARHRDRDPGAHSAGRRDLSGRARARPAHRQVAGGGRVRRLDPDRAPARRDAARLRLHLSADHARQGGAERAGHPQHVLSAQSAERAALL